MEYILFLDFDGTLAPIAPRPHLAKLTKARRELLEKLSKLPELTLAIVSGRKLDDLKQKVGLRGVYYAGNHGFEISGPKTKLVHPKVKEIKPLLKKIKIELKKQLKGIAGLIIEDKGPTLSIHYRCVKKAQVAKVKRVFNKVIEEFPKTKIKVTSGKKVFEIRPKVKWDKGEAVRWFLKKFQPAKESCPIYIGDDTTDEDAFKVLSNKGVTIRVGKDKNSLAQETLKDVEAVYKFLQTLLLEINPKCC